MEGADGRRGRGSPPGGLGLETHSAGSLRQHKDGGGLGGEAAALSLRAEEAQREERTKGRSRGVRGRREEGELKL